MTDRRSIGSYVAVIALFLSGCALETPYLDSKFGQASEQAQVTQSVAGNRANPSMQMDARSLHNSMTNYMGDQPAPKAIQGVLNSSSAGGGQ